MHQLPQNSLPTTVDPGKEDDVIATHLILTHGHQALKLSQIVKTSGGAMVAIGWQGVPLHIILPVMG